jgi:hypothetical protein
MHGRGETEAILLHDELGLLRIVVVDDEYVLHEGRHRMLLHKAKFLEEHLCRVRTTPAVYGCRLREVLVQMGAHKLRQSVMSHVLQREFVTRLAAKT